MLKMRLISGVMALAMAGAGMQVVAQTNGFDPTRPCGETLRAAGDTDKMLIAAWVFGYRAGAGRDARPVHRDNVVALLTEVFQACGRDEGRSLVALMRGQDRGGADPEPGSRGDAERLLGRFLQPDADLAALTAALAPDAADIAAVYGEPLASRLVAMYAQMFRPGVRIGPKPGQDALIVVRATTFSLERGDAVLGEFPGGYRRVLGHMVGDYPIVRFKFVAPGESTGMAFDGLIHVNGRWVLMPKPWRALE